jgi:hypothetical protein
MEIRDNPANSMIVFTWGGRVFLMPRIPGDIPRLAIPDSGRWLRWEPNQPVAPPERKFCRVSFLDGGDCPLYVEVQP